MRRTFIILAIVAVLLLGGFFLIRQRQAQAQQSVELLREASVERGPIEATVSATGSIEPEAMVSLTFGVAGTVREVNVVRGQMVSQGAVLASLGAEELALAVKQAEDNLRIQQLTLQQRLNSRPSPATLAAAEADIEAAEANLAIAEANVVAAQASVAQAQARLAQVRAGPTTAEVAAAEAEIGARAAEVRTIEDQYDRIIAAGVGGPPEEQTRSQLGVARQALAAAEARLATLRAGARPADVQVAQAAIATAEAQLLAAEGQVAAARANVSRARAAYDRLLEGPTEDEIAILEAQVVSVETNLQLARLRFNQSVIEAPITGRVASVRVNAGEQASPGAPALILVDEVAYHIEVNVDEIDVDRVAIGQPVEITLDALTGVLLSGVVSDIAPTAAGAGGVVTYLVTINIDAPDVVLRPGMSANASIVVERLDEVLMVPNWAIRLDRETGRAYVNRLNGDGTVQEVVVETGLRNEQFSQVISGLAEGDRVVVTHVRQGFSFFGNQ
jgi:HlyD family secretion protein